MPGIDFGLRWKGEDAGAYAVYLHCHVSAKVGSAKTALKEGVSAEKGVSGLGMEADASPCVSGGVDYLQGVLAQG